MQDVIEHYRAALGRWGPYVVAHFFIRILVVSLIVPLISAALALALQFSDQTALTDQDIARFLLTPVGAIGAVVIFSLLLLALVLDVVVATAIVRHTPSGLLAALRLAAGFVLHAIPRLVPFVALFLIRVLAIVLPFAIAAGGVALVLLTDYDINYYLTERPPEFIWAIVLIGLVLVGLAGLLLIVLSGWAIGMHLSVFDGVAAPRCFGASRAAMDGHRLALTGRVVVWVAIRALMIAAISAMVAFAVTTLVDRHPDDLGRMARTMVVGSLVYSALSGIITAVANGALAGILNAEFDRALAGRRPAFDDDAALDRPGGPRSTLVLAAVAVICVTGLGTGGLFASRLDPVGDVTIIGHRGAGALAPENTMAAVQRAIADGADMIEIDVQESAEGEIIVVHDSDFMKSARVPTKVWDVTADELAEIDIGSWFDPAYAQERVPRLIDVLDAARGKAQVIIELKYYGHDVDLENRVVAIVEAADMADQISTMSLKYGAVQNMRQIRPDWRAGVLAAASVGDLSGLEGDFVALNQARITSRVIEQAEASGKDVYAWTVNDPMTIARMLWIGADGLITDNPAQARQVVVAYDDLSLAERVILALSDRIDLAFDPDPASDDLRP